MNDSNKSGFFDIPEESRIQRCRDPEHNFPSMLHIPPGKGYRHVCYTCGKVTTVTNPAPYLDLN